MRPRSPGRDRVLPVLRDEEAGQRARRTCLERTSSGSADEALPRVRTPNPRRASLLSILRTRSRWCGTRGSSGSSLAGADSAGTRPPNLECPTTLIADWQQGHVRGLPEPGAGWVELLPNVRKASTICIDRRSSTSILRSAAGKVNDQVHGLRQGLLRRSQLLPLLRKAERRDADLAGAVSAAAAHAHVPRLRQADPRRIAVLPLLRKTRARRRADRGRTCAGRADGRPGSAACTPCALRVRRHAVLLELSSRGAR